jgi:hypothetical protein
VIVEMYCPDSDADTLHDVNGPEAACRSCGSVREIDADQIAGVVEVEDCPRCRQRLPVGHACDMAPKPCLRKTGLWPCGACTNCLASQESDPRYGSRGQSDGIDGSPGDLGPWPVEPLTP